MDLIERTQDELKTANYRRKELLPKTLEEQKRQLAALQNRVQTLNMKNNDFIFYTKNEPYKRKLRLIPVLIKFLSWKK